MGTDFESLADTTCSDVLSAKDLKTICRFRGFSPPKGDKAALAAFVAPRLLESTGIEEAMASLDETWLVALHRIAMEDSGCALDGLHKIISPGRPHYMLDYRALFRQVADGLLNRGVVLVEDTRQYWHKNESRFAHYTFQLPQGHRP